MGPWTDVQVEPKSGEMDKFVRYTSQIFSSLNMSKSLKSVKFGQSYSKQIKGGRFGTQSVYIAPKSKTSPDQGRITPRSRRGRRFVLMLELQFVMLHIKQKYVIRPIILCTVKIKASANYN